MSFARTSFGRLLTRLHLEYKHEGDHHNLYREVPPEVWFEGDKLLKRMFPPQLVYSDTDTSKLVDWVVGVYVPNLLATGTVPPPPEPTPQEQAKALRRELKKELASRGISSRTGKKKMTKTHAVLNASMNIAGRGAPLQAPVPTRPGGCRGLGRATNRLVPVLGSRPSGRAVPDRRSFTGPRGGIGAVLEF